MKINWRVLFPDLLMLIVWYSSVPIIGLWAISWGIQIKMNGQCNKDDIREYYTYSLKYMSNHNLKNFRENVLNNFKFGILNENGIYSIREEEQTK